jgi:hypothetical protein
MAGLKNQVSSGTILIILFLVPSQVIAIFFLLLVQFFLILENFSFFEKMTLWTPKSDSTPQK